MRRISDYEILKLAYHGAIAKYNEDKRRNNAYRKKHGRDRQILLIFMDQYQQQASAIQAMLADLDNSFR